MVEQTSSKQSDSTGPGIEGLLVFCYLGITHESLTKWAKDMIRDIAFKRYMRT